MIKRSLDFFCSLLGLVMLAPIMILIAILVKKKLGTPVLFRQARPGLDGKLFTMIKFRTMRDEYDAEGNVLPDGERLTDFGVFLRSSSLDELPELWNVLKGEMSIVGPRPLLERYSPFFKDNERLRFSIRPGITGWAQINGRNQANWDQRLADDIWYVKNRNIFLDIKIIYKTISKVLSRDGAIADANLVMEDLDVYRKK